MSQTMRSKGWRTVALLGLLTCSLAGCVDRRFLVESLPPGAMVHVNGKPVGPAPADIPFTHYGKYQFTLVRDGYQTLVVEEDIRAPWYAWFPLDFVTENLLPWTMRDVRHLQYTLHPLQVVPPEAVLERAQILRSRGQGVGIPAPPPGPPVPGPALPGQLPPGAIQP